MLAADMGTLIQNERLRENATGAKIVKLPVRFGVTAHGVSLLKV